ELQPDLHRYRNAQSAQHQRSPTGTQPQEDPQSPPPSSYERSHQHERAAKMRDQAVFGGRSPRLVMLGRPSLPSGVKSQNDSVTLFEHAYVYAPAASRFLALILRSADNTRFLMRMPLGVTSTS